MTLKPLAIGLALILCGCVSQPPSCPTVLVVFKEYGTPRIEFTTEYIPCEQTGGKVNCGFFSNAHLDMLIKTGKAKEVPQHNVERMCADVATALMQDKEFSDSVLRIEP